MDTTFFQLTVYACPQDQRAALVKAIQGLSPTGSFDGGTAPSFSELVLGNQYTDGLAGLMAYDDYATRVEEAAPGATFICWTDGTNQGMGRVVMYAPDLGRFESDCDDNGTPLLTQAELHKAILEAPEDATREQIVEAADRAAGVPWLDRLDELVEELAALRTT